ncbi:MAG: DinB family protein [Actinomycetota bacterium]
MARRARGCAPRPAPSTRTSSTSRASWPGGNDDGSLFAILAHLAGSETRWLQRWLGEERARMPGVHDYGDLESLAGAWAGIEQRRAAWLGDLQPADLERIVWYVSVTRAVREQFPLWQTLLHVSNHITHHRSEACTALTALGAAPSSVDLLDFLRDAVAT